MEDGSRRGMNLRMGKAGRDMSGIIDKAVRWPGGAQIAVMLTFDFDAETLWLSRDPENARRPGTLSQGTYGAKVGVPKILDVLDEAGLKATFFVPGWTAENHSSRTEMIVKGGHEVAHHSYSHKWVHPDHPDQEVEEMERGLEALKRTVGVVPRGYRSPAGESSDNMVRLLHKHGFLYAARCWMTWCRTGCSCRKAALGPSNCLGTGAPTTRHTRCSRSSRRGQSSPTATSCRCSKTSSASCTPGAACSTWSCTRRSPAAPAALPCCAR